MKNFTINETTKFYNWFISLGGDVSNYDAERIFETLNQDNRVKDRPKKINKEVFQKENYKFLQNV